MDKKNIKVLLFTALMLLSWNLFAQEEDDKPAQGCANLTIYQIIGKDTVELSADDLNNGLILSCDMASRMLYAKGFAPGMGLGETDYVVEKIKYDPPTAFDEGEKLALPKDDCWGQALTFDYYFPSDPTGKIPDFSFVYYGKSYKSLVPNSNGAVHLYDGSVSQLAGNLPDEKPTESNALYCPFAPSEKFPDKRTDWGTSPSPVLNSICLPFQDIDYGSVKNSKGKDGLYLNMIGEYPCRKVIFSINNVPMYGYKSTKNTSMVVLYETTHVIEFYIKEKPEKTSTNGGNAILGIQNEDGTIAHTITNDAYAPKGGTPSVKSYNNTNWQAKEEAWRIKPVGQLGGAITWYIRPTDGPNKDKEITLSAQNPTANGSVSGDGTVVKATPEYINGPTWYVSQMTVTRTEGQEEGELQTFVVKDSVLIIPFDMPSVTFTHQSADNQTTINYSKNSASEIDTVCTGDKIKFTLTGGVEYQFIEPLYLADKSFNNGVCIIDPQPTDVESVHYKIKVTKMTTTGVTCDEYVECDIYNRTLKVDIGEDAVICKGDEIKFADSEVQPSGYDYTYSWLYKEALGEKEVGNESSLEYVPLSTGDLTLKLKDNMGCSAEMKVKINVYDYPKVTIEGQRDVCKGSSTVLTAVSSVKNSKFRWNDPSASEEENVKLTPDETTEYQVVVTNPNAECVTTATTTVSVVPYPQVVCMDDQTICSDEMATVAVSGAADRYSWETLDASVNGATGTYYSVSPENTTKYTVHAFNNDTLNCESTADMMIVVSQKPIIDFRFSPDAVDELSPQVMFYDSTVGLTQRLWEFSDGSEYTDKIFLHEFDVNDSTYSYDIRLTGYTADGCVDSLTKTISVARDYHLWVTTGVYLHDFNPANRTFKVQINNVDKFSLKVFDRWGGLVWESEDPNQAWDCKYKGENVTQGVYTWIAQYTHKDQPNREIKKTGTVMIFN